MVEGTLYDADALMNLLRFLQEKSFFPNYLEAYSHLSQTWPAFSIRSQKKVETDACEAAPAAEEAAEAPAAE